MNQLLDYMCKKLCRNGEITPHSLSWNVIPKINALFRVGDNEAKQKFFSALIGDSSIEEGLAVANKAHRIQTKVVKEIVELIEPELDHTHNVLVAYIDKEYKNYSGLIANKLLSAYHKPTLVLREYIKIEKDTETGIETKLEYYSGSVRSPIPIAPIINDTKLANCQGHDEACGIFLKKENIDLLVEWFDNTSLESDPEIPVTAIIESNKLSPSICKACIDNSMLWGKNISAPTFYMKGTIDSKDVNYYRKQNTTIKFNMNGMDFLKFRASEEDERVFGKLGVHDVEIIFTPSLNEWNGNITVQGLIESYEISKHEHNKIEPQEDWEDLF